MRVRRGVSAVVAGLTILGTSATAATALVAVSSSAIAATPAAATVGHSATWKGSSRTGYVRLRGQIPLVVTRNSKAVQFLQKNPASFQMSLNFGLPLRHQAALNALIAKQGKDHTQLSRAAIYREFAPSAAQYSALRKWLMNHGFRVTHIGRDRTAITARAKSSVVDSALKTNINDYERRGFTDAGIKVAPFVFYSNTIAPRVPARLGVQSISGLNDVGRFFTDIQMNAGALKLNAVGSKVGPNARRSPDTRSGGYYPRDVRAMYDVTGSAVGQTVGFTLWGAGETQKAMTDFATDTGDTANAVTVDPACTANGTPFQPSSCTTVQEQSNHLITILENGNLNGGAPDANNFQYAGNAETGLDIEQAHGMAQGSGMKYYDADCSSAPPVGSGLSNATCNGSDVGLEDAMEDAADDPTLHSVSNSWGYGGDTEFGTNDPFYLAAENSLAIGAAAGTTFYFSTGDDGTFESGFPADSQYVVSVGGTSQFSTAALSGGVGTASLSTETTWAAGGAWCSSIEPRPSWQQIPAVVAHAGCPGRVTPDISAIADTNTSVFEVYSNSSTTDHSGAVGGTSVAAPEMNGMEAVTEAYVASEAANFPGGTAPAVGFEAPTMYQMGTSSNYSDYFRDVVCGNNADPSAGPDGESAQPGWDSATGWGAIDSTDYNVGYAQALGATGLTTPNSLSQNYSYTCAQTPTNAAERGVSLPTNSVGYSVGSASNAPWASLFLPSRSWGASNTFLKTTDGGATWEPTNSDMLSVACPTATTCVEVGDGGRIRRTTDSGTTWTYLNSPFTKALTKVVCPSATICYTAGDRGAVLKSTDGGATWSFLQSADGNPIYGLSCPSTTVCYATDNYAHVMKTTNGGSSWLLLSTPVTTPGIDVPGSGGPNPFAGLFGISCMDINDCVAVGGFPASGTDSPIVTTTNGGNSWTLQTSNSGANNNLADVSCAGGTCYAVGRAGAIVYSTTPLANTAWTAMTSNVTTALNDITCLSASTCVAIGQGGTVDVLNGGVWTPTTAVANPPSYLSGVTCVNANDCYTVGLQGVTVAFDSTNVAASAVQQAGGGTTQQMNSISCVDAADCVAVGNAGTILTTSNAGQTWLPSVSSTTSNLAGVSCNGASCEAVGAAGTILSSTNGGIAWTAQTSGTTTALTGISCATSSACVAVGSAGTILTTATGGTTWTAAPPLTPAVTANLSAVTCPNANNCYIAGAVVSGNAVLLASTNGGSSWTAQTSASPQALTNIACTNATSCFAGGGGGTVVSTVDGGNAWAQQGNPLSGPTTALNATVSTLDAINAAACSSARCVFGTGSSGDIMTTPLVTVTVNANSTFGTAPNLSNLSPNDNSITVSPAGQANNLSGSLTCSTTAADDSDSGTYPVSECGGLSDNGFSVVYDLADSSETVNPADQTIDFPTIPETVYAADDFTPTASASSNLPVSFSANADDSGICSVTLSNQVEIDGAGQCTIIASQAGDNDYNPAANQSQTFTIDQATQTIDLESVGDHTYGDPDFTLSATASSGLPVTLVSNSLDNCTVTNETATTWDVSVTGGGQCSLTASQDGNTDYLPAAPVDESFNIGTAAQTITFNSLPDKTFGDGDFTVSASASSGLSITYTAANHCTVDPSSGLVHLTGAGTCTITASQGGNSDYEPANDQSQTFTIHKEAQTIDFGSLPDVQFGSGDITVSATSGSGDDVMFSVSGDCTIHGDTVHLVQVGSCTVTASQPGDANFSQAPDVMQSFDITQGDQSITFAGLPDMTLGASDFTVSATASSGDTVAFTAGNGSNCTVTGTTVHLTGAGSCSVIASQSGDSNYNAASSVTQTFSIHKASPTMSIAAAPSPASIGTVTYTVGVQGVAGFTPTGAVTVSDGSKHCSISSLSSTGTGSCNILETAGSHTITASYAGNSNFTSDTGTLSETVKRATPTVSFTTTAPASPHGTTEKLTFTATVKGVSGIRPTGTVTVHDGRGDTCTGNLNSAGTAKCSFTEKKGLRSITAHYNGDTNYIPAKTNTKVVVKG